MRLIDWLIVLSLVASIWRAVMLVCWLVARLFAPRRLVYRVTDRVAANRLIRSTRGRARWN